MSQVISVPTRDQVSANNQAIFDNLSKALGFVPNLYATLAHSETALGDYLAFQNRKLSISAKEKEIIHLIISQTNECTYCLAAHTVVGKMNGFSDEQILEIRRGEITFNTKFNTLAKFVQEASINRGSVSDKTREAFFAAGYTPENLIDVVLVIGAKTVANYLHKIVDYPIDFPSAPVLKTETKTAIA